MMSEFCVSFSSMQEEGKLLIHAYMIREFCYKRIIIAIPSAYVANEEKLDAWHMVWVRLLWLDVCEDERTIKPQAGVHI